RRHEGGGPAARVRPLLHDEGARQGDGPRPRDGAQDPHRPRGPHRAARAAGSGDGGRDRAAAVPGIARRRGAGSAACVTSRCSAARSVPGWRNPMRDPRTLVIVTLGLACAFLAGTVLARTPLAQAQQAPSSNYADGNVSWNNRFIAATGSVGS